MVDIVSPIFLKLLNFYPFLSRTKGEQVTHNLLMSLERFLYWSLNYLTILIQYLIKNQKNQSKLFNYFDLLNIASTDSNKIRITEGIYDVPFSEDFCQVVFMKWKEKILTWGT